MFLLGAFFEIRRDLRGKFWRRIGRLKIVNAAARNTARRADFIHIAVIVTDNNGGESVHRSASAGRYNDRGWTVKVRSRSIHVFDFYRVA